MDIADNNVIKFKSLSKKKNGLFANFKVNGIKNGVTISASLAIDLSAVDVDFTDPIEKIIADSAELAMRELQGSQFHFEGLQLI